MPRPLRTQFPGAIHHVTCRGNRRSGIFTDDFDRLKLLDLIDVAMHRCDATALAYCLMGNHFHLVVHTPGGNLSRLMHYVNGVYSQTFNARHQLSGHLFQGRFHAVLVDNEPYLVELCRYVEQNPVRAGWVATPWEWMWSSCLDHTGKRPAPRWLDTPFVLSQLLGRSITSELDRQTAVAMYEALVGASLEPSTSRPPWTRRPAGGASSEASAANGKTADEDSALLQAHRDGGVSMGSLARRLKLSTSTVSRRIRRAASRREPVDLQEAEAQSRVDDGDASGQT